jgi:hypothetical protein
MLLFQPRWELNYEPPRGPTWQIADRAGLHRVAEVTVDDCLARIGKRLEPKG